MSSTGHAAQSSSSSSNKAAVAASGSELPTSLLNSSATLDSDDDNVIINNYRTKHTKAQVTVAAVPAAPTTRIAVPAADAAATTATAGTSSSADDVTESMVPSHILQDGRFVHLPPPSELEKKQFFERSVAKYDLLQQALQQQHQQQQAASQPSADGDDSNKTKKKEIKEPKIHPLAMASARLQNQAINELNRLINLSTLVSSGEYFGLSNIVDPSLEIPTTASAADAKTATSSASAETGSSSADKATSAGGGTGAIKSANNNNNAPTAKASPGSSTTESALELQQEQRCKAVFVLKRKRGQLEQAVQTLQRHSRRLQAAVVAQALPDSRLRQLRPQWRLAAPEHGTRARPHATRPTEVIACDVDVYSNNNLVTGFTANVGTPTIPGGDGHQRQTASAASAAANGIPVMGRLARRVPRYATMEIVQGYKVHEDFLQWRKRFRLSTASDTSSALSSDDKSALTHKGSGTAIAGELHSSNSVGTSDTQEHVEGKAVADNFGNSFSHKQDRSIKMELDDLQPEIQTMSHESSGIDKVKEEQASSHTAKLHGAPAISSSQWIRAEPFMIADPSLGKLDAEIDAAQTTMLTLEMQIEKPSTGFCIAACLEPVTTLKDHHSKDDPKLPIPSSSSSSRGSLSQDESLLTALQHSLFCAKLFESVRREVAPDTVDIGQVRTTATAQSVVWLSGASHELYVPPPHMMSHGGGSYTSISSSHTTATGNSQTATGTGLKGTTGGGPSRAPPSNVGNNAGVVSGGLAPVCVIHVHEGEVKVQLDCEYTLRLKLMEAQTGKQPQPQPQQAQSQSGSLSDRGDRVNDVSSGSQSSEQLFEMCRALLLHAQEGHHRHSAAQMRRIGTANNNQSRITAAAASSSSSSSLSSSPPRILQRCVNLGAKMLLEHRVRACIHRVQIWMGQITFVDRHGFNVRQEGVTTTTTTSSSTAAVAAAADAASTTAPVTNTHGLILETEWLALSVFDLASHFTMTLTGDNTGWCIDATIYGDGITVTELDVDGCYRKAQFYTDQHFELYLKVTLRRVIRICLSYQQQRQQQQQPPLKQSQSQEQQHQEQEQKSQQQLPFEEGPYKGGRYEQPLLGYNDDTIHDLDLDDRSHPVNGHMSST